ncbi:MAG: anthranilate/aminodeoxychorismate synthase component II [Gammaproteobacteria bacterium]|nr:MAG: anthranilate/aminodeoxychorismate synthase component II [Gammaproteobacteria bacterium]RKZ71264.1 MAG: anthranilate/aminodeoxychorismate synthase component II [Gammaproteobacteria bacterium]
MLLMIDNYDSFTYNLVQYFGELGEEIIVYRNDKISIQEIEDLAPERIVVSPGPCTPNEAGISLELIEHFKGKLPLLGVCLGHQSIGQAFGGRIVHAKEIMHGKTSEIYHNNNDVFAGLDNPFTATRYHSLVIEQETLPDCFEVTAWTQTEAGEVDEIMGVRHKEYAISGVQFHPESIMTSYGHELLKNFLEIRN